MKPARKTIADAKAAHAHFGANNFTERDYKAWNIDATRLETLVRHGLVHEREPEVHIDKTYTPPEFLEYVQELFGEDLWGYEPDIRWNEQDGVYEFVHETPLYNFE